MIMTEREAWGYLAERCRAAKPGTGSGVYFSVVVGSDEQACVGLCGAFYELHVHGWITESTFKSMCARVDAEAERLKEARMTLALTDVNTYLKRSHAPFLWSRDMDGMAQRAEFCERMVKEC